MNSSGNVIDLSKFASKNELDKWICAVLGLPGDVRHELDHAELVQALGTEVLRQRMLLEVIHNALQQVGLGALDVGEQTVAEFAREIAETIETFEIPTEVITGGGS